MTEEYCSFNVQVSLTANQFTMEISSVLHSDPNRVQAVCDWLAPIH